MNNLFRRTLALAITCVPLAALDAETVQDKKVGALQANHTQTDCFYFTLEGVSQADPVTPGNPWFAVLRSQNGSKDAYAMLLAARISGTPVTVYTDGVTACGYARAISVMLD